MQQNAGWVGSRLVQRAFDAAVSLDDRTFIALALVLFILLSSPFFLHWPPPMADEEMFGDAARTLAQEVRLASTLVAGQERGMYWQPPLYFLILAPVIQVAGWSLVVLRAFSAVTGMVVVVFTYLAGLSLASRPAARVGTILLVFHPHFIMLVKHGRMDGLCVLFILVTLVLAHRAMQRKEPGWFLLPGASAAAAILTHPLGFIAPASILLWLLFAGGRFWSGTLRRMVWFLVPMFLGLGLWLLFILQDPEAFLIQMRYQFARKDRGWSGLFLDFIGGYRFLPLFFAAGVLGSAVTWQVWRRSGGNVALLLLLVTALVSFLIVGTRFEVPYHVYWVPFASLVAGVAAVEASSRCRIACKVIALAALLNGAAFLGYIAYAIHWKEQAAPTYRQFARSVAALLPDSCSVITAGYPSLYWAFQQERPDIRYMEKIYFDSTLARQVIGRLDYFICTRSFSPGEDASQIARQVQAMDSLAARVEKKLLFVGGVGEERRFVASAKVYKLVSYAGADIGHH